MPNVKNLIKQHNSKILNKDQDKIQRPCNCRIKETCHLNGKCFHQCMVYKAEKYSGASEVAFKSRYSNHTQSFRNWNLSISHINDRELSKYLWTLKANGTDYHLKWSIKSYASRNKYGRCDLCLTEKKDYCSSRPKSSIEQKNWTDIKMSP